MASCKRQRFPIRTFAELTISVWQPTIVPFPTQRFRYRNLVVIKAILSRRSNSEGLVLMIRRKYAHLSSVYTAPRSQAPRLTGQNSPSYKARQHLPRHYLSESWLYQRFLTDWTRGEFRVLAWVSLGRLLPLVLESLSFDQGIRKAPQLNCAP